MRVCVCKACYADSYGHVTSAARWFPSKQAAAAEVGKTPGCREDLLRWGMSWVMENSHVGSNVQL